MRLGITFLIGWLLATMVVHADESFATLKVGNMVYTNVTVTSVSAKNISFTYAQGMASVKLKDLDPAMQKHFHFDGTKAAAEEKQAAAGVTALASVGADNKLPYNADPKALMDAAIAQVKEIVNQPVTTFPLNSVTGNIATYDTWFHPGAIKPDFDTVDVRKTQDTSEYNKSDYITSKLNPSVAFPGKEVEFNAMTKYFYTDRSLPKKKLNEPEMLEINRLYRIIGQCEARLGAPKDHGPQVEAAANYLSQNRTMIIGIGAGVVVLLLIIRMATKRA